MHSPIELKRLDAGACELSAETLAAFARDFRGVLLRAGEPDFDAARSIWNGMIDRRPALIARAANTADVARTVKLAKEYGLLLSVRSGGHNIAGLAVCEGGLMLDLSLLNGVRVDAGGRRAVAEAGCTLADVDAATAPHGLAAVLGFVSTTGIAGLTVGGGFGYLTRRFGWTCDNLASVELVTPDGELTRASRTENAELFWCLRGGGGNFGVVTAFEYELHPVGPEVFAGAIAWRGEDAPSALRYFADFARSAPRELTLVTALRIAPPAPWLPPEIHGKPLLAAFVCHTGDPSDGEKALAPLRAHGRPIADVVKRRPYTEMQCFLDKTQPKGRRYYWKSEYLPGIAEGAIDQVVEHAKRIQSPHSAIIFFQLEGALNELPAEHSPVGNRDAAFVLNVAAAWDSASEDEQHIAWARTAMRDLHPYSTGGAYLNFLTEEEGHDRVRAAYGESTLLRLATLKKKYDPQNLFRHTKAFS
jgi:FAD/FMN-containing dehydrogenase